MAFAKGPQVGQMAPDFELPDGNGQRWRLSANRGKIVVLLFYPGDETPVCTKQLCSVRDNWERYLETGAELVGINTDTVEKHHRFAEHYRLPMRLLADPEAKVVRAYDMKGLIGTRRGVIVIDQEGMIRFRQVVLPIFRPSDAEVLAAIREVPT